MNVIVLTKEKSMKKIVQNRKSKVLISILILLFVLVGCQSVVDRETGQVLIKHVISLDTPWNLNEMGFFTAILIYPMAQIINFVSQYTGVTLAIVIITLAINLITMKFTVKSTIMNQRMQLIQPEMTKIQEKYADRKDQQSQMRMSQEIQGLYQKYDIKMSAMFVPLLLQMPVLIAVWQSVQRSAAVVNGELFGYSLALTTKDGILALVPFYFGIFIFMAVGQIMGMLGPQWLNKRAQKKLPVYKQSDKPAQGQQMNNFMIVFMLFIGFSLPAAMCIYLGVSSLARFFQTWYIQEKYINKEV